MNIYQNCGIGKLGDAGFSIGTVGDSYTIESAQRIPQGYDDRDVVQMDFRQTNVKVGAGVFEYGLIGETVFYPFMREMKVDSVDNLVGREVLVFASPNGITINGIAVKK